MCVGDTRLENRLAIRTYLTCMKFVWVAEKQYVLGGHGKKSEKSSFRTQGGLRKLGGFKTIQPSPGQRNKINFSFRFIYQFSRCSFSNAAVVE